MSQIHIYSLSIYEVKFCNILLLSKALKHDTGVAAFHRHVPWQSSHPKSDENSGTYVWYIYKNTLYIGISFPVTEVLTSPLRSPFRSLPLNLPWLFKLLSPCSFFSSLLTYYLLSRVLLEMVFFELVWLSTH